MTQPATPPAPPTAAPPTQGTPTQGTPANGVPAEAAAATGIPVDPAAAATSIPTDAAAANNVPADRAAPAWRRKVGMVGLLVAETIAGTGTRMSILAIPWLVLVTTGSPIRMGLVSAAELVPYVLSKVFTAPLQDRMGHRRTSILADVTSAAAIAAVALGHQVHFGLLLALVAVVGATRSAGERARTTLFRPLLDLAGTPYARATSAYEGLKRTSTLVGASVGGVAIAFLGAEGALWLNAATFVISALIVVTIVPDPEAPKAPKATNSKETQEPKETQKPKETKAAQESYVASLHEGFRYFRSDRLMRNVTGMLFVTNLFNQASAVIFVPLWVMAVLGSPLALGSVAAAFAAGAILGNIVFTVIAPYVPRYPALVVGYLIGGMPRYLVLALSDNLAVVVVVTFISGVAMCSINPTIGAAIYQRVPQHMLARAGGILAAVSFAGIPLGGLVAGATVSRFGLANGILLATMVYFAATLSPIMRYRIWRELDDTTTRPELDPAVELPRAYRLARSALGLRIRLTYVRGEWTVQARRGLRTLIRPRPVPPKAALTGLAQLTNAPLHDTVGRVLSQEQQVVAGDTDRLRAELAAAARSLAIMS